MRKPFLSSLVAVAWLAFLAFPSAAQTPDGTTAATAAPPKGSDVMIGDVEVHANWRTRVEIWDWFDTSLADGDYTFAASVLRLGLSQKRKSVDWQFEVEQPSLLGLPTNATAPAPQGALGLGANYFESNGENAASVFVKQAFIRIKNLGAQGNSLRLGRFDFIEGNERTTQNATLNQLKSSRIAQRLMGLSALLMSAEVSTALNSSVRPAQAISR